jgi:beta-N-acetylhexosaminidase
MNKLFLTFLYGCITACSIAQSGFQTDDYFRYIPAVEAKVDSIFSTLSSSQIAGQLIMPAAGRLGQSDEHIEKVISSGACGGILLLNGTKDDFTARVKKYNELSKKNGHLPLIFSADAEPSLINYKIKGTAKVIPASSHKTREEVRQTAITIAKDLKEIGIQLDFAPVIDISTNNEAIGNRSFGDNADSVVAWSSVFVETIQKEGVAATAKHFPGHGRVKGDTHKQLVYIDGEMTEVPNYIPLIENKVLAIMVAHIAVQNNEKYGTNGLPATVSRNIVTDLLRKELKFDGLIVTDAMNMGGAKAVEDRMIMAISAGCDILLMPKNEMEVIEAISKKMQEDAAFRNQVHASAKRILRFKVIMGMM